MSSDSKITVFKNNKNNKLTVNQCQHFFKDYIMFKKGRLDKLYNPKTNKQLIDNDRIEFIYKKCRKKIRLDDDVSPASSSSSSGSPFNTPNSSPLLPKKDNEILLDSYAKLEAIIAMPFNNINKNRIIISSLFSKPIALEEALLKLKEYLHKTDRQTNIYVDAYHRILEEINGLIDDIYYNNTLSADLLVRKYNWIHEYKYDPFKIHGIQGNNTMVESLKKTGSEFKNLWKKIEDLNSDIRVRDFMFVTYKEYKQIVTYSENNKNRQDTMRNLEDKKYRYYAIQFILVQIRDTNVDDRHTYKNTNDTIVLIDKLLAKDIFEDIEFSMSVSKSISWSGTPRSSSSNHSHFQSKANIEKYRVSKAELLREISDNNVNDSDPYTLEEWSDMPLRKLKNVIYIKYTDNKNKTFSYAFYIRTLYQAWRIAVKNNKPFINPYTRKLFTQQNKTAILNDMMVLYPGINRPTAGLGRKDILYKKFLGEHNIMYIFFKYIVKVPNSSSLLVELIHIQIPLVYEIEFPPEYLPQILFDNIDMLIANNKVFGKSFLLKTMEAFTESNNKRFLDFAAYKYFFDKIKNAV